MRKLFCEDEDCGKVVRSKGAYDPKQQCTCGGRLLIRIKGDRDLQKKIPDGVPKIARRMNPVRKDGSQKSNRAKALGLPNSNDINQMSNDEIQQHLIEIRRAQMSDLGLAKGKKFPLERPDKIRRTKVTIARMLTVLRKREVR